MSNSHAISIYLTNLDIPANLPKNTTEALKALTVDGMVVETPGHYWNDANTAMFVWYILLPEPISHTYLMNVVDLIKNTLGQFVGTYQLSYSQLESNTEWVGPQTKDEEFKEMQFDLYSAVFNYIAWRDHDNSGAAEKLSRPEVENIVLKLAKVLEIKYTPVAKLAKHRAEWKKEREEVSVEDFEVGQYYQVTEGAGLDSGRIGRCVDPKRFMNIDMLLKIDNPGVYKPFNSKTEVLLVDDRGQLIPMFPQYLTKVER